ncbi:neurabin-1-like [Coregonus clupeaformis]|uniref:neurabin-1-like n=1 Tax=Coregonus clupeaformis TaxID=59861 RepID=UPI001E1C60EF|nr:neurabin-1-like [Coregonus clupeaformis]
MMRTDNKGRSASPHRNAYKSDFHTIKCSLDTTTRPRPSSLGASIPSPGPMAVPHTRTSSGSDPGEGTRGRALSPRGTKIKDNIFLQMDSQQHLLHPLSQALPKHPLSSSSVRSSVASMSSLESSMLDKPSKAEELAEIDRAALAQKFSVTRKLFETVSGGQRIKVSPGRESRGSVEESGEERGQLTSMSESEGKGERRRAQEERELMNISLPNIALHTPTSSLDTSLPTPLHPVNGHSSETFSPDGSSPTTDPSDSRSVCERSVLDGSVCEDFVVFHVSNPCSPAPSSPHSQPPSPSYNSPSPLTPVSPCSDQTDLYSFSSPNADPLDNRNHPNDLYMTPGVPLTPKEGSGAGTVRAELVEVKNESSESEGNEGEEEDTIKEETMKEEEESTRGDGNENNLVDELFEESRVEPRMVEPTSEQRTVEPRMVEPTTAQRTVELRMVEQRMVEPPVEPRMVVCVEGFPDSPEVTEQENESERDMNQQVTEQREGRMEGENRLISQEIEQYREEGTTGDGEREKVEVGTEEGDEAGEQEEEKKRRGR